MYTTTAEARDVRGNPVRSEPSTAQDKSQMNKHQLAGRIDIHPRCRLLLSLRAAQRSVRTGLARLRIASAGAGNKNWHLIIIGIIYACRLSWKK
ncbi:MAG: hypothetical protein JNJ85_10085 [Candidatus Kapabacteria bacterium]|nr:hypothetical protein [Candidatus Kapabacteria bacterium]